MDKCEIVIIGGGVIGAAAARALRLRGRSVTLVERGVAAGEASGAAAGILGALSETDSDELAALGLRSIALYPDWIAQLADRAAVDFWRVATIRLAYSEEASAALRVRRERAQRLGAVAETVEVARLAQLEPLLASAAPHSAVLFPREGRVSAGALTAALIGDLQRLGAVVRTGCSARRLRLNGHRVTGVETSGGPIACDAVVDAAGAWAATLADISLPPVVPLRGQMVALAAGRPPFWHTVYSDAVYAAARRDGTLLLGSTRESTGYHKAVTAAGVSGILARAFALAPSVASALRRLPVTEWWSGLRPMSPDGMPLVGFVPEIEGYMIAGGHGRNGVLLAPITAELVADAFDGRTSAAAEAVSPARFAARAGTASLPNADRVDPPRGRG